MILQEITNPVDSNMESKKFGVNVDDVGFIINAITNLYADPISSIVRELASNCRDADQDKKFIVGMDNQTVFFRDFGTGMSRDFMLNEYLSIGKSTKRSDASLIGGFGFGRLSVISYTDNYFVTSCYDGTKTKYLISNDGQLDITVLAEEETEETGTLVCFNHQDETVSWRNAITTHTAYFQNCQLHLEDVSDVEHYTSDINGTVLKVSKSVMDLHLVMGECYYPLDMVKIRGKVDLSDLDGLNNTSVGLYIPIEEGFRPVPSREAMIYTEEFKTYVRNKLDGIREYVDKTLEGEMSQYDLLNLSKTQALEIPVGTSKINYFLDKKQMKEVKSRVTYWNDFYGFWQFYKNMTNNSYSKKIKVLVPENHKGYKGHMEKAKYKYNFLKRNYDSVFYKILIQTNDLDNPRNQFVDPDEVEIQRRRNFLDYICTEHEKREMFIPWENFVSAITVTKVNRTKVKKEGMRYLRPPKICGTNFVKDNEKFNIRDLETFYHYIAVGKPDQTNFQILEAFSDLSKKKSIWLLPNPGQLDGLTPHKIFNMKDLTNTANPILTKVYHQILIDQAIKETGLENCEMYKVEKIMREIDRDLWETLTCKKTSITDTVKCAVMEAAISLGIGQPEILWKLNTLKDVFHLLSRLENRIMPDELAREFRFYYECKIRDNDKKMRLERLERLKKETSLPFNDSEIFELTFNI